MDCAKYLGVDERADGSKPSKSNGAIVRTENKDEEKSSKAVEEGAFDGAFRGVGEEGGGVNQDLSAALNAINAAIDSADALLVTLLRERS